jgi:hypothetical protein
MTGNEGWKTVPVVDGLQCRPGKYLGTTMISGEKKKKNAREKEK